MSAVAEEPVMELRIPARADRMVVVRASVRSAAQFCGFGEIDTNDIVLAVGEACQNVILHSYAGSGDGDIVVGVLRGRDRIVLRVIDFAPPFDPTTVAPRDLEELRPGGLGMHFIYELMDAVDFQPAPDGDGNVLQMTKKAIGIP